MQYLNDLFGQREGAHDVLLSHRKVLKCRFRKELESQIRDDDHGDAPFLWLFLRQSVLISVSCQRVQLPVQMPCDDDGDHSWNPMVWMKKVWMKKKKSHDPMIDDGDVPFPFLGFPRLLVHDLQRFQLQVQMPCGGPFSNHSWHLVGGHCGGADGGVLHGRSCGDGDDDQAYLVLWLLHLSKLKLSSS